MSRVDSFHVVFEFSRAFFSGPIQEQNVESAQIQDSEIISFLGCCIAQRGKSWNWSYCRGGRNHWWESVKIKSGSIKNWKANFKKKLFSISGWKKFLSNYQNKLKELLSIRKMRLKPLGLIIRFRISFFFQSTFNNL